MKKNFRFYLIAWVVVLALFNVLAFVVPPISAHEKYTASFWVGYIFITVAFLGQAVCSYMAFKADSAKKLFYNISLIQCSYAGLIASIIFGGVCMIVPVLPYWVGMILCVVVLAVNGTAVVKATAAVAEVERVDNQVKERTAFIKTLTVDADTLMEMAKSDVVRAECKKVYDAIRYSDPMSSEELRLVESKIGAEFAKLSEAVKTDNPDAVKISANELVILVRERNNKCKLLK